LSDEAMTPTLPSKTFVICLLFVTSLIGYFVVVPAMFTNKCSKPCVPGNESIMRQKEHGSSHTPVQEELRWNCDSDLADRICNYNRHFAERSGYWEYGSTFLSDEANGTVVFYDSNTGFPLFTVPGRSRTWEEFIGESRFHGWPSFRDDEVNWKYVRVLPNGETVSTAGTHLGHNLPDTVGNRYCINLVSIAGNPKSVPIE
jgi:hypothetical protein